MKYSMNTIKETPFGENQVTRKNEVFSECWF